MGRVRRVPRIGESFATCEICHRYPAAPSVTLFLTQRGENSMPAHTIAAIVPSAFLRAQLRTSMQQKRVETSLIHRWILACMSARQRRANKHIEEYLGHHARLLRVR
jgi:thiaminase